jgi:tetratricopeptide (TPR) repeat protein
MCSEFHGSLEVGQRLMQLMMERMLRPLTLCIAAVVFSRLFISSLAAAVPLQALEESQQLIQKGELVKARAQLAQVLRTSPKDPNALNLIGIIDAQEGKYRAAQADFQKAIAAAPRFTGAYLNLGHLYQENISKDPEALKKAVATYERLLKFEPANLEANYQSAYLLWRLGSYQASLERLARLSQEAQERPQALAVRCGDNAGLQDFRAARTVAEQLLMRPDLTEADVLPLLSVLIRERRPAAQSPGPPQPGREQGKAPTEPGGVVGLRVAGRDDLAASLIEGLDNRRLASASTLDQLAALYEQAGKLDRARATLERVAQLQTVSAPLLIELARVANQQGDQEGTLGYLAHARDLDPQNAAIHFFFGIVCVEMNLVQEAYNSLQKAVSLSPNNAYYNYALGSVMMARDNVREAYPYLKKYCELKPEDPRGRLALGAAYFYGHDPELARQELEGLNKYPQTAPAAHYFLGRLANQEGQYSRAVQELEQAIALNPRYADAYAELGLLHLKQKEYAESEKSLRKALEINPDSYTANLHLMILFQRTKDPRAEAQAKRFDEIKKLKAEREKEFLRTIEVRPY